jgi:hypothetical protein
VVPDFSFADKNVVPKTYNGTGIVLPPNNKEPPKKKEEAKEYVPKYNAKSSNNPISQNIVRPKASKD